MTGIVVARTRNVPTRRYGHRSGTYYLCASVFKTDISSVVVQAAAFRTALVTASRIPLFT